MSRVATRWFRCLTFLALLGVVTCDDDPSGPPEPAAVVAVDGDAQVVTVGSDVALVVEVRDQGGQPIAGVEVTWSIASGGGALSSVSSTTGADGRATVTWTLGGTAGVQSVEATAGSASVTFTATATPGDADDVSVTPGNTTITAFDATQQLTVTVEDAQGNDIPDPGVTFTSDAPNVASVDDAGLVTAHQNGTATITATSGQAEGTATVVVDQEAATVAVVPNATTMALGSQRLFEVEARDANDFLIEEPAPTATWSATGAVSVDGTGNVTADAEGAGNVTGTVDGVDGSAVVDVIAAQADFEPQADQAVDGVMDVGDVTIGPGITITATADLTINASGDVDIQGTLEGDCVSIAVHGEGSLSISGGTVGNVCATDPDADGRDLVLVGNGQLTVDDAEISSSGSVTVQNDPSLTDADFDDIELGTPGLPDPADLTGFGCALLGARLIPTPSQAPTSDVTGQGRDAKDWSLRCRGDLSVGGSGGTETLIKGQDGGDSAIEAETTTATGRDGGNGGKLKLFSTGNILFSGNGGVTLMLGRGGNGGDAVANGIPTGGDATAEGGDGGRPGELDVRSGGGISIGENTLRIVPSPTPRTERRRSRAETPWPPAAKAATRSTPG